MGNNCGKVETIEVINRCSGYTGATGSSNPDEDPILENFCTYSGGSGKSYRKQWCGAVGNIEWTYKDQAEKCHFDQCSKVNQVSETGCCHGCCSSSGHGVECQRDRFTGVPALCCLNDYAGCGVSSLPNDPQNVDLCWSDFSGQGGTKCNGINCRGTCDPCLRDVTSDGDTTDGRGGKCSEVFRGPGWETGTSFCQEIAMDYCTGADLHVGDSKWIFRWMEPNGTPIRNGCLNVMVRNLYKGSPNNCGLSQSYFNIINGDSNCTPISLDGASVDGINYSSELITQTFARYQDDGFIIGSLPGFPGYNPFQDFLYSNVCCRFPNLCQASLGQTCSVYTTSQLASNPSVANWCGCYLPLGEYSKYVNEYQVNPECTPPCNRPTAIPKVNPGNQPVRCTNDTCIIDDLAINLAQTNVGGLINISQVCGNCSPAFDPLSNQTPGNQGGYNSNSASCSCIIENNTVNIVNSDLGSINTGESCTSTTCYVTDPSTGNLVSVPCDQAGNPGNAISEQQAALEAQQREIQARRNRNILIVLGIALLVIFIAALLLRPKTPTIPEATSGVQPSTSGVQPSTTGSQSLSGLSQDASGTNFSDVGFRELSPGTGLTTEAGSVGSFYEYNPLGPRSTGTTTAGAYGNISGL